MTKSTWLVLICTLILAIIPISWIRTDAELDVLNEDSDFVYEQVLKRIY